ISSYFESRNAAYSAIAVIFSFGSFERVLSVSSMRLSFFIFLLYIKNTKLLIIQFKNRHKRFLRNFYISYLAHAFLSFFLFFQQFSLPRNITPVTFCRNIFSKGFNGFARDYFCADGRLDWNIKLLPWD